MRLGLCLLLVFSAPFAARAQDVESAEAIASSLVSLEPELPVAVEADRDARLADELFALRLAHRQARTDEGIALLTFGLASVALGAGTALGGFLATPEDPRWLSLGLGTAGWGAINAIFSAFLFDLGGAALRDLEADRALRGRELEWAREDAARDQYATATVIAVNAGLDVFYVATGILLFIVGDQALPDDAWLEGYGIAMASQGAVLFAYDVSTWVAASARGDATRELFRDEELPE